MIAYDPSVIRSFAQQLYDRAATIVLVNAGIGLVIGGLVGKLALGNGGMVVLGLAGAAAGYFLGSQKAFLLKLQAQISLCQVQIEENTRRADAHQSPAVPSTSPAMTKELQQVANSAPLAASAMPMGRCPNCSVRISLASEECPECRASFAPGSAWHVLPA